jgi:hypothetical protein
MKFVTISTDKELIEYQALTAKYINVVLPLDYLKKSKVIALKINGKIRGGFVLVTEGPFRVIDSIPSNYLSPKRMLKNILSHEILEITGLWLNPNIKDNQVSLIFWLNLYFQLLISRKKYCTYAYSLAKPKLGSIYKIANPRVLFSGKTNMQPGMSQPEEESVEIVSIKNIAIAPFSNPDFLLKKLIGNRNIAKNYSFRRKTA